MFFFNNSIFTFYYEFIIRIIWTAVCLFSFKHIIKTRMMLCPLSKGHLESVATIYPRWIKPTSYCITYVWLHSTQPRLSVAAFKNKYWKSSYHTLILSLKYKLYFNIKSFVILSIVKYSYCVHWICLKTASSAVLQGLCVCVVDEVKGETQVVILLWV